MKEAVHTDLMIIGAGMAGMSAALFAANRGISTIVAGAAGALEYSSGLLDLWGLNNQGNGYIDNPWQAVNRLNQTSQWHPLAGIAPHDIQKAFDELCQSLKDQGLTYQGKDEANSPVITAFGTVKPSYRIPLTMARHQAVLDSQDPVLILDIQGLREFRAGFVQQVLEAKRPNIDTASIVFPGMETRSELSTPLMAQAMETQQVQDKFAAQVAPLIKGKTYLGIPAILGINGSEDIWAGLEKKLDIKIFEIPTAPVSVPGIRFKESLKKSLEGPCVTLLPNQMVKTATVYPVKGFVLDIASPLGNTQIKASHVLLASGRFLSGGLISDRCGVKESIFNLPLGLVPKRENWHGNDYFDPRGHKINQAGILTDASLRPLDSKKNPIHDRLFAAGSILGGQDWMHTRSGAGLSIATAFHGINCIDDEHFKKK